METVTLSSKGQVVIPQKLRAALGLQKGQRLLIDVQENRLVLEPLS